MSAQRTSGYLANLTPLRGLAALAVVIYHYSYTAFLPHLRLDLFTDFFSRGYLAVDFFFLLSGFIISHVYGGRLLSQGNFWWTYRDFIMARLARIYPLHFFALLIMLVVETVKAIISNGYVGLVPINETPFSNETSLWSLFTNLFLLHALNVHATLSWNEPSWSISAEWWTYVLFPLGVSFFFRLKVWTGIGAYLVSLGILYGLQVYNGNLSLTYHYGLGRCLLEFGMGILLYRVYQSRVLFNVFVRDATLLAGIGWVMAIWYFPVADTLVIPGFSLILLGAAHNQGYLSNILTWSPLRWLGHISYAVYMLQIPLQKIVEKSWKLIFHQPFGLHFSTGVSWLMLSLLIILLLAVATLAHRWLEIPAQVYLRKRWRVDQ